MSMNRYMDGRQVFDRRHGPSTTAAGDGQEGVFSGVLHTAPSGGTCQVIIPALGLTSYRTANVAPYVSGSVGDTCLIAFDEGKIPWVISAQSLQLTLAEVTAALSTYAPTWTAPALLNSWTNGPVPAGYLKDPFGFVHLRGRLSGGATGTMMFALPAGFRPGGGGAGTYAVAGFNSATPVATGLAIDTSGNVDVFFASTVTDVGIGSITFLAEN